MAVEIHAFQVLVAKGTPKATPQLSALSMPARLVERVEIRVPPGPRGQLGFALAAAGNPILPSNPGAWIVADDKDLNWTLEEQISSGAWQLLAYNTGAFDHTLYLDFHVQLPANLQPPGRSLLDPALLASA